MAVPKHVPDSVLLSKDANLDEYTMLGVYGCGYPRDVFSRTRRRKSRRVRSEGDFGFSYYLDPNFDPDPGLNYDLNLA
jgi:hypothetical protein